MTCIRTIALCAVLALSACGGNRDSASHDAATANGDAPLPKPESSGGSVTGMPDKPGPRQVGPPVPGASPATTIASDGNVTPVLDGEINPGAAPSNPGNPGADADSLPTPAAEPTPQDAVAVVRDYYAAVGSRDYARAWAMWSDAGKASGQTEHQFADGFADTVDVVVRTDAPGQVGAAAGSRYIEVPVAIDATQRDGSVRKYSGTYTLRRAVVDGATADQRAWRVASARLHEVQP